jgi:hypothetical protein
MNYIQIKSELHFQLSNNQIYLNEIENKNHRRYLTKFRISAHNLEIEMGRYKNKPRDERLCFGCLKVENEVHFLFECNSYSTLRDDFTSSISSIVPNYLKLNNDQIIIYLMNCEDKFCTCPFLFLNYEH